MKMQKYEKKSHDCPFQFIFTVLKIEIILLVTYTETSFVGWLVITGTLGYKKFHLLLHQEDL